MSSVPTPRRPDIAGSILFVGAIAYVLLCGPAISRRGYPPIDPIWIGVTYLWIAPICLSALFDSFSFRSRCVHLVLFAIITGFFNAGAVSLGSPRFVNAGVMLAWTISVYGPVHLLAAFATEALMQQLLRQTRTLIAVNQGLIGFPRITLLSWTAAFTIACLTIGFPFAYRSLAVRWERARGAALAEAQWATREAVLIRRHDGWLQGDVHVEFHVDPDVGLPLQFPMADFGYSDAYNARIEELITLHGPPDWSLKEHVPSAIELAALLDSPDLVEVTSFPFEVTPNIRLLGRGGPVVLVQRDRSRHLTASNITTIGDRAFPVHVRINDNAVVIRVGKHWVGVFHRDGTAIATASRF